MTLFPEPQHHSPGGKTSLPLLPGVYGAAQLSDCRRYRTALFRWWTDGDAFKVFDRDFILWIGMNPSTADHNIDDPTLRRWQSFARREGLKAMVVCNVMDWRATNPRDLLDLPLPVSADNVELIRRYSKDAAKVVACWGAVHPKLQRHVPRILTALDGIDIWCLGRTASGFPRHPLYLRSDTPLELFRATRTEGEG